MQGLPHRQLPRIIYVFLIYGPRPVHADPSRVLRHSAHLADCRLRGDWQEGSPAFACACTSQSELSLYRGAYVNVWCLFFLMTYSVFDEFTRKCALAPWVHDAIIGLLIPIPHRNFF
jgi:hypothetical protein